ncbi:hypothetical protein TNCV_1542391 [Trichonephila clavipes]|nr:hypothetical protein TNCV_1542391 [Trichonephila clavipes]
MLMHVKSGMAQSPPVAWDRRVEKGTASVSSTSLSGGSHLLTPVRQKAHGIHHGKGLDVHLSLTVALSTIQVTVRLSSVPPVFGGRTPWGRVRDFPPIIPDHQPHEMTCGSMAAKYPRAAKAIDDIPRKFEHLSIKEDKTPEIAAFSNRCPTPMEGLSAMTD